MDLPTAVLLVVLVALGVMIVIVLEHRLSRIRRRSQTSAPDAVEQPADVLDEPADLPVAPPSAAPVAIPPTDDSAAATSDGPLVDRITHVLMHGDTELGTLTTRQLDPPWLEGTFEATHAFSRYRPLFDRELELLQHSVGTFDQAAFVEQWQRIFGAGLWIRADPEGHHVSQFLLHIRPDGTARLRYG